MAGFWADDGNNEILFPDAESGEEAAAKYIKDGDWGVTDATVPIVIYTWREGQDDVESHIISIHPEEPDCSSGKAHFWRDAPDEPILQSHGSGIFYSKACIRCGLKEHVNTAETCMETGREYELREYLEGTYTPSDFFPELGELQEELDVEGPEWALDALDALDDWDIERAARLIKGRRLKPARIIRAVIRDQMEL